MNLLHRTICPLCGNTHFSVIYTCKDFLITGETFSIVQCDACGFRLTQDAPAGTAIDRYYESDEYISHSETQTGLVNRIYHLARKYMMGRKARLILRINNYQGRKLLDIGAGSGCFANEMYLRGWNIVGIEKSAAARQIAKQTYAIDLKDVSCLDELTNKAFDVVTMWHVLEHIENLDEEFHLLRRVLKKGGHLVAALPNSASADEAIYKANWAAYDVPRHLWHFTPKTLQAMAKKYGFSLEQQIAMPLDGFYIAMLSEKHRGRKAYFLRGLWRGFICLLKAQRKLEKSSSIVYILKKQPIADEQEREKA